MENGKADNDEALANESRAALREFVKKKRQLPSPSNIDPTSLETPKRQKAVNHWRPRYQSQGSSLNAPQHTLPSTSSKNDFTPFTLTAKIQNSTLKEGFVSCELQDAEMDSLLERTEVSCDQFEQGLAKVKEMIANEENPYLILTEIVDKLAAGHKNCKDATRRAENESSKRSAQLNSQIVNLENDLVEKINFVQQTASDKFDAIETSLKCMTETKILWINFIDPKEAECLRMKTKGQLFQEVFKMFARMNIRLNSPGRAFSDVFIQRVTIFQDGAYTNDLIMGIKFFSAEIVSEIRQLIIAFVKRHFTSKDFDAVRYTVRDNWSYGLRQLLKVCYELQRLKMIQSVYVKDYGILVGYEKGSGEQKKNFSALIRGERDLNDLRIAIGDVGTSIPSLQFYNADYFKSDYNQKLAARETQKTMDEQMMDADAPQTNCNENRMQL